VSTDIGGVLRLSPLHVAHARLDARFENLSGWEVPRVYTSAEAEAEALHQRVGVADISAVGKILVRGNAAGLLGAALGAAPTVVGGVTAVTLHDATGLPVGPGSVTQLASDEFLLVTPAGVAQQIVNRLELQRVAPTTDDFNSQVSIVDRTSGLAGLLLAGPRSRDLLSKLSALPLAPERFPNQCAAQTSVGKVHATVVRQDMADVVAFDLYFDRSYGEYLWNVVLDAGLEFGIHPFGTQTLRSFGREL
jgi:heterotetrameric sarcosine oxidase gamma subunit